MTEDEFRVLGHHLVDRIAGFLAGMRDQTVNPAETPTQIRHALDAALPLPEAGKPAGGLLNHAADLLFQHSLLNGHPRFHGYITSSAAPIGMLAEMLSAAVNANAGAWKLSPMATEIEAQTIRWIAEFIGYPAGSGGLLVSGGNMANITCFLAARTAQADWDIRREGVDGKPRLLAYVSAETHTWIQKAADIAGLGTDAIRWIASDPDQRMDLAALKTQYERDMAAGFQPFLVVGTAGTVSTGAVDPLPELADFCEKRRLWFHVDGAYGALASGANGAPSDLTGLSRADSVAVDPHKWLYAPIEAGCALVRNAAALHDAFSFHPPYYHFATEATNYLDLGPQNTRGFRALKVWLALQQAGTAGYRQMIGDDIVLARHLYSLAAAHRELEALTHQLSITTLRYVPMGSWSEDYLNPLNQVVLTHLETCGEAFCSNAVINGKHALRFCVVNFRTSTGDIEALPELVARLGRQAHAELSGPRYTES